MFLSLIFFILLITICENCNYIIILKKTLMHKQEKAKKYKTLISNVFFYLVAY